MMVCSVSDSTKAKKSKKPGAQQGEQTQHGDIWEDCINAIMKTDVYKASPIGRKRTEQKMRDHVAYICREYGQNGKRQCPNVHIQLAVNKRKTAHEAKGRETNERRELRNSPLFPRTST